MPTCGRLRGVWLLVALLAGCASEVQAPGSNALSLSTTYGNVTATSYAGLEGDVETVLTDVGQAIVIATLSWDARQSTREFRFADPHTQIVHTASEVLAVDPEPEEMNAAIYEQWLEATASPSHEALESVTIEFVDSRARSWFTRAGDILTLLDDPSGVRLATSAYDNRTASLIVRFPSDHQPVAGGIGDFGSARPDVQSMAMLLRDLWVARNAVDAF